MSYRIGIDTIYLRPTPRLAHIEYNDHTELVRAVEKDGVRFMDAWQYDLIFSTNDGPVPWSQRGRVTNMGHAEYMENGADFTDEVPSPFIDSQEVLSFDAVEEYGLPDHDELVAYYQDCHCRAREEQPECVRTGGYYKTIISGAIAAFGWDMLLMAAAEEERFERVLDSIFRLTMHHVRAWAATDIEVFIQHDDFVWSEGAFMDPAFYRRVITPRYAQLWKVLHGAGKKVLFCSDGNWIEFLDDIAEAGADGFIFEPMMPLETIIDRYGQTHVIIGSKVDCRTMTFGSKEDIRSEIDATLALARDCPGFFFAVGNHIPSNVPLDNALFYFDHLSRNWAR